MEINNQTPLAVLTVGQFLALVASKIPTPQQPTTQQNKFISLDEVVVLTGYSKATIYKMCSKRSMPFYKAAGNSRKLTFRRDEIESWLAGQRFETHSEFITKNL